MAALADDDPRQGGADLTGEEALGAGQRGRRGGQVHVVEDDRGGLAAELEGAAGDPLAADGGDAPAGGRRPGEGDLVDPRVADQELGHLPVRGHHVEHARREADRLGDLRHDVGLAGSFG